jgi:predicted dehydrogenase/threonine dehydrogenase-like Zn-dependent dehydrogenase
MKQVVIKGGRAHAIEVPAPQVGSKNILVRVHTSCISTGTEMAGLKNSALPLYKRALQQPENVKKVLDMVRDQGIKRTRDRVMGRLQSGLPTGYSASGVVVGLGSEVSGFELGDRVACAGSGVANHAEWIDVPVNLAVHIPGEVDFNSASTVTLGAIAMQGVRRAKPQLSEVFVVIGLGILGQITAQLLVANGCVVIGVDPDQDRVDLALKNGMHYGVNPNNENYIDRVMAFSEGVGADGVIVTAASKDNQIIREAMQACRKKGRIVLVGDVGLDLHREDFYAKELDFFISCSYGPGRYDPFYEQDGQDYPLPYVRWTENRNMEAYLNLISKRKLDINSLIGEEYLIDDVEQAYISLDKSSNRPLIVLLKYPCFGESSINRVTEIKSKICCKNIIKVGLVGGGSFAQGMHLPNLIRLRDKFELYAVMSRTGINARAIAEQYGATYATTDFDLLIADPQIDLVIITTRHNLHGELTLKALQAGKNVFVEKPLATSLLELNEIESFYKKTPNGPILMTGYNRRFSPAIIKIQESLQGRTTPLIVNYRMNAGFIPLNNWIQGAEGAGRNIGEACHIYDLFAALTKSKCVNVQAISISPNSKQWAKNDNFITTLKYADGSVCSLTYTSQGHNTHPKERMDIYVDGSVISMDDFKRVEIFAGKSKLFEWRALDKGQFQEMKELAESLTKKCSWPIALDDQLDVGRISLNIEDLIKPTN